MRAVHGRLYTRADGQHIHLRETKKGGEMGTSERTNSGVGRQRGLVYGLLFAAVAWMGLLAFGNTAYAADSTSGDTANASNGTATGASGDATETGNSTGTGATQAGSGGSGLSVSNQKV